jgi:hypothetical protein
MLALTNCLIVLIQHQLVHLALIHIGIAMRVVVLTLQTSGHPLEPGDGGLRHTIHGILAANTTVIGSSRNTSIR